jgi:hypothetical protein
MTVGEAISRVRNQIKSVKQDANITNRFLYSLIMKHARFFMHRQDNLNRIMKFNSVFQTLNFVELITVDKAEAQCFGVDTGCWFKRTKDKLPKMIEGYYGPLLRSVSSLDLSQQVIPTFPMTFQQMSRQSTFKYNNKKYYWYLNGYLYFPNLDWDAIRVEGVYEDDISKYNCDASDDCLYVQNSKINIPEFLFSEIEQLVMRDLGVMIQIPSDPGQNAASVTA